MHSPIPPFNLSSHILRGLDFRHTLLHLGHNRELVSAVVLGGVFHGHLADLDRHRGGVAAGHLRDDQHRLLQRSGALLQSHEELLLTLLVGEQLLVVAHTHAHQALAELITEKQQQERTH